MAFVRSVASTNSRQVSKSRRVIQLPANCMVPLANLAGAPGKALACDETGPAEFFYVPAAPGHAEKSGNARVGPSARAIIAAYDGYVGRLALPWKMRKARPPPPIGAAPACPANIKPEVPGHPKIGQSRA